MAVEAFHCAFKYGYLKGKVNKRVDECLLNLIKYIRDKSFDRVMKLSKGESTHRIKLIQDQHDRSKNLPIELIKQENESKWKVQSSTEDDISYNVFRQAGNCLDKACQ